MNQRQVLAAAISGAVSALVFVYVQRMLKDR